jgi:hypothetical protein
LAEYRRKEDLQEVWSPTKVGTINGTINGAINGTINGTIKNCTIVEKSEQQETK